MSNTQLAERPQNNDLRQIIQSDKVREQLAMALPRYYTPEQFTVIVRTAINRNPKLAECDPGSFLTSMITAAQMGIAPDGRNGHLIPRWNSKANRLECTFQADYKGLVGLVRKNESVSDIYAEPVHANDAFRITKGLHRDLIHEVDVRADRGAFIGAYAVISYKDGTNSFEFMSKQEIDAIKARSQSGNSGPWVTDYSEMAKKTVIKRLLKLADLSQETAERIAIDNSFEAPAPASQHAPEIQIASIPQLPTVQEPTPAPTPEPVQEVAATPEPIKEVFATPAPVDVVEVIKEEAPKPPRKKIERKVFVDATPEPVKEPAKEPAKEEAKEEAKATEPVKAVNPNVTRTREALKADGFTEDQLVALLIANQWGDYRNYSVGKTKIEDLDSEMLESFWEDDSWEIVKEDLTNAGKKGK